MRKFLAALCAAVVFAAIYSSISYVPVSRQESNVYYFGFFETFAFVLLYSGPVYFLLGIPLSIMIEKLAESSSTILNKRLYLKKLAYYAVAGLIVGAAFILILMPVSHSATFILSYALIGLLASIIYYHSLLLFDRGKQLQTKVSSTETPFFKPAVAVATVLAIIGVIYFSVNYHQDGVDQTYILPENFTGCVTIYYNKKDAPPLEIKDNEIVYYVPDDGIIETSSPAEFGWTNKKSSGAYQLTAYYVDEEGKKIRELSHEEMPYGGTGSMQDEKSSQDYSYQAFGTDEAEHGTCP
ncbi:hypothetical protein [Sporosarcina sp.]|uniref:DUF6843 domain-containing protein n=1 Tax=Sporosarcina sp. TaxID=49982 RepID=UPI00261DD305|nr:hypothetical protein [Sporosarcina sp.]